MSELIDFDVLHVWIWQCRRYLLLPRVVHGAFACHSRAVQGSPVSSISSRIGPLPPQRHSVCVSLVPAAPDIRQSNRITRNDLWKKGAKRVKRQSLRLHCKSIQSGTFEVLRRLCRWRLNGRSFQDALRAFFPPIRNDDPRLDFYTIYEKEVTQYDTGYVKRYDDDLNTTLIFVRPQLSAPVVSLTCS